MDDFEDFLPIFLVIIGIFILMIIIGFIFDLRRKRLREANSQRLDSKQNF